jgi:hypothetical protein
MKVLDKIVFDAKVSERKILMIPTDTIIATPYNPASRTKEGIKLRRLSESVRKYGVIQPLVITADRDLVDGNRRLHAAKMAGMKYIECIILPMNVDKDEVFCEVNTTAEKIGGKGWLEACRHGYRKPPNDVMLKYEELSNLVGIYGVDLLIEKKIGLNILDLCKSAKSLGLVMRLDSLIIKVAQSKLTNRINAIYRSDIAREEKVQLIEALLA